MERNGILHSKCPGTKDSKEKMAEALIEGPIYFFDQPNSKRKWDHKKMEPKEYFNDINPFCTLLYNAQNFHRNSRCMGEHIGGDDVLVEVNSGKKDQAVLQPFGPSEFRTTCEQCLTQFSHTPSALVAEAQKSVSFHEYKCMARTVLCELEEMFNHFSKFKLMLPQGILNVLSYSWKELTEGAWHHKKSWPETTYESVKSAKLQTSEEANRLSPVSEINGLEMAETMKTRKSADISSGVAKGTENPGTLLNRLPEKKTSQDTSNLPFSISFSLTSKVCQESGWVSHYTEDLEWKSPDIHAVKRTEHLSQQKASGIGKPVILHHYSDVMKDAFTKNIKESSIKKGSSELLYKKSEMPVTKKSEQAPKKLHYRLIDGSSLIFYPSGHIAVCQSSTGLPFDGLCTNVFNDFPDCALIGTFTPSGRGSVYSNSSNTAMLFNQEGGMVTNKDGEMLRQWKWPGERKLNEPVIIQVNEYITVKIAGRFGVRLIYKWRHERVCLSLLPVRGVAASELQNLEPKTSEIPEEDLGQGKEVYAARELRILRWKIKNILEDWMKYYQIALEISLSDRCKNFTFLPRRSRRCPVKLMGTSVSLPMAQERIPHGASVLGAPPACQSSTSYSPNQGDSSRVPRILHSVFKTDQCLTTCFDLNKGNLQIFSKACKTAACSSYAACPVALRRTMLGEEAKTCRCSSSRMPYLTDLEYDHIIKSQVSSPEQIVVVCVTDSLRTTDYYHSEDMQLDQLYERKNKNRIMPCIQGRWDSFRLLKYDINSADEFTCHCGSLLLSRHNIAPGMFLMYIQGKLLFVNYIFNGYSRSVKDLKKQITLTRSNYNRGYYLPTDYKLSSLQHNPQTLPEHIQARLQEYSAEST